VGGNSGQASSFASLCQPCAAVPPLLTLGKISCPYFIVHAVETNDSVALVDGRLCEGSLKVGHLFSHSFSSVDSSFARRQSLVRGEANFRNRMTEKPNKALEPTSSSVVVTDLCRSARKMKLPLKLERSQRGNVP